MLAAVLILGVLAAVMGGLVLHSEISDRQEKRNESSAAEIKQGQQMQDETESAGKNMQTDKEIFPESGTGTEEPLSEEEKESEKGLFQEQEEAEPESGQEPEQTEEPPAEKLVVAIDPGHQGNWVDMSAQEPSAPGSSEMKAKATTGTQGRFSGKMEFELNIETEPTISVSKTVNLMKSYTTYHIWERYPDYLRKQFWKEHTFGQMNILLAV